MLQSMLNLTEKEDERKRNRFGEDEEESRTNIRSHNSNKSDNSPNSQIPDKSNKWDKNGRSNKGVRTHKVEYQRNLKKGKTCSN